MEQSVYTVSALNGIVKALLDSAPELQDICVRGELSNYKIYPSGHHYFTLKDAESAVRCVMFKGSAIRLRFRPESAYVQAFAEGRCLELGRGNEEITFGRAACLDVNAEIVEMAKSGPGCALYFTREGLVRL